MKTIADRLRLAVLACLVVTGCTVSTEPVVNISVTGTVTQGGDPVAAIMKLTAGNYTTEIAFSDGSYSITVGGGVIPQSSCSSAAIRAQVLAEGSTTELEEQTEQLGDCGTHVVHFEFP